jgi:putative ABC transport system ATP-binding protein
MNTRALVVAEDLRIIYGHGPAAVHALNGVSIEVRRGEVLLIVGPSGSGKTTLLQTIGALLQPTSGSLHIGGQPTAGLSPEALGRLRLDFFGFVFQSYNLIPMLNGWENVAVALDLKGIRGSAAERRSRTLLNAVGVSERADAFPAEMSGGQKQRVAIARALAPDPEVVLADEPTASLDSASGWRIIELLCDLAHSHQRAVVIVTHDNRLLEVADRAIVIEDGRIVSLSEMDVVGREPRWGR